jgi:hypothetical protein
MQCFNDGIHKSAFRETRVLNIRSIGGFSPIEIMSPCYLGTIYQQFYSPLTIGR